MAPSERANRAAPAALVFSVLCTLSGPSARGQVAGPGEEAQVEETAPAAPGGPPVGQTERAAPPAAGGLPGLLADPSQGGKVHLTYRAVYEGKFFRFHPYHFNFPDITADDLRNARELEERHRRTMDHDLDQYLSLRTHDLFVAPKEEGYLQGLDTQFSARFFQDLDGTPRGDESFSSYDSRSAGERFQLRTLNATARLLQDHLLLTAGRMYVEGAERATIDGGDARVRGLLLFGRPLEVEGFAGSRVSFFSTVPTSTTLGGAIRYWPWTGGRLELADFHLLLNTFQATFDQRLAEPVRLSAIYRQIDQDPQSLRLELNGDWPERGWTVWVEYFGKFGLQAQDLLFDYLTPLEASEKERRAFRFFNLGDLDPFDEGTVEARWSPAGRWGLFLGGTAHLLRGRSREDQFNHRWFEGWLGADALHLPWEGLTSRATLRYLATELPRREPAFADPLLVEDVRADGEPSFLGLEILLEQDLARRVAVGATLELRRYEYDSRFARVSNLIGLGATAYARYRQNRFLSYSLTYLYDRDDRFINPDLEEVHALRAEVAFSF